MAASLAAAEIMSPQTFRPSKLLAATSAPRALSKTQTRALCPRGGRAKLERPVFLGSAVRTPDVTPLRARGRRGGFFPGSARCQFALEDVPHIRDWVPDIQMHPNPLGSLDAYANVSMTFVAEEDIVLRHALTTTLNKDPMACFRRSGPREMIAFNPTEVKAAIVTCGGLCPGLNTVIREIVGTLWFQYGVRHIQGIDGGYRGFYARNWINLTPKLVTDIHKLGGTFLGTSRGGHDTTKIVNAIEDRGINQVYIIGGDGTQRGALKIAEECRARKLAVVTAGIPKTIDNDIPIIDKSFGFDTAVEEAQRAIKAAHVEAESTHYGVGIVKLMGRECGQIAMFSTLASRDVDCCLLPEVPFFLEGENGLFKFIETRLLENDHCVIVVAEGAGQDLIKAEQESEIQQRTDPSGNKVLLDVRHWLSDHIKKYFHSQKKDIALKYIDPTYMIRAIPANAGDNVYCTLLAHSAVHGAMAGYSGFTTGPVNGRHCYIPTTTIVQTSNKVVLTDRMWARLLASTSQPTFIRYQGSVPHESAVLQPRDATSSARHVPDLTPRAKEESALAEECASSSVGMTTLFMGEKAAEPTNGKP